MSERFTAPKVEWFGADGSYWELEGDHLPPDNPVLLAEKPIGIYDAPITTNYVETALSEGGRFDNYRYNIRDVALAVNIFGRTGDDWQEWESRFCDSWSPYRDGRLQITTCSGARWLFLKQAKEVATEWEKAPQLNGHAVVPMVGRAEDPFWHSDVITDTTVFDGIHYASFVTVMNPADVHTWPKWVLTGPARWILPDFSWKGDEQAHRMIRCPYQTLSNSVVIDTDIQEEMAVSTVEANWWSRFHGEGFLYPVPARMTPTRVPVYIDPLPLLPKPLPLPWTIWLAKNLTRVLEPLGQDTVLSMTAEDLSAQIISIMREMTPDFLEELSPEIFAQFIPETIAEVITRVWGSIGNRAGAAAQLRLPQRWRKPWGVEAFRELEL